MGSTHKGKNLLQWEQILFFKSRSHFGRALFPWKQSGDYKRVLLGKKMIKKQHEDVPIHFIINFDIISCRKKIIGRTLVVVLVS